MKLQLGSAEQEARIYIVSHEEICTSDQRSRCGASVKYEIDCSALVEGTPLC